MRRSISLGAALLLLVGVSACGKDGTGPELEVTSLTCDQASNVEDSELGCTLTLMEPAGFKVKLESIDCRAHGNLFRITAPIEDVLVEDGCYAEPGVEIVHAGPFPTGTQIAAEIVSARFDNAPKLRVTGAYEGGWTIEFEDGEDEDYNDLIMSITAIPAP
jgi:hypothetical protein